MMLISGVRSLCLSEAVGWWDRLDVDDLFDVGDKPGEISSDLVGETSLGSQLGGISYGYRKTKGAHNYAYGCFNINL